MNEPYEQTRQHYLPKHLKVLLVAESPPPALAKTPSSRHFYRTDLPRRGDRLFTNTIQALYPEVAKYSEADLESQKETWLRKFQADGWYMIEALETSLPHEVTKRERQELIAKALPQLIDRIKALAGPTTRIILIKSNVFEVAAEPLRAAGFTVLNKELLDYPGHFNQQAYRQKPSLLAKEAG